MQVKGIVVPGYGVASGASGDPRFPDGTLGLQVPLFRRLGLDLTDCFAGTINVDISPKEFSIARADFRFESVAWSPDSPCETFSFCRCRLFHKEHQHRAWIYYPHSETKPEHFHSRSLLEILAPPVIGLNYGDEVAVEVSGDKVECQ